MEENIIKITLFGRFTITYQNEEVELTGSMGKQLIQLLELLIYYRNNALSRDLIIRNLWGDNDNPANAMKFSVFRLRNALKQIPILSELNLINTSKSGYVLNPDYTYYIDIEQFEEAYRELKKEHISEQNLHMAQQLLTIYEGDIYSLDADGWTMQANTYFRSVYQDMVKKMCTWYQKEGFNDEILATSSKAAMLFPEFEEAHIWYLRAMMENGDIDQALAYFRNVSKMMADVYDHPISEQMRNLYRRIMLSNEHLIELHDLKDQLTYAQSIGTAFYCEYDIFEYMYQNALQIKKRTSHNYYLVLFNLLSCASQQELKTMNRLRQAILKNLRSVDIVTRVNKVQFVALLQSKDEDGVYTAAQRVMKHFIAKVGKEPKVAYYVQKI